MEKLKKTMMTIFAVAILMMPVVSIAGSLEPSAAPAPTMKTLDQIPPTWSQKLQCDTTTTCPRFEVVLDGDAVLDKETGLVWEKSPSANANIWVMGTQECNSKVVGGRNGWHLPTIEQLASLLDTSVTTTGVLRLPTGHPFTNVETAGGNWSATTMATAPTRAWAVSFASGTVGIANKTDNIPIWCVRGGQSYDGQ